VTQDDKVADAILEILADGTSRTTEDVQETLDGRGAECAERAVRVLMLLKHRKRLNGEFDPARRSWVWSLKV